MSVKRVILLSDTHYCHIDWYGLTAKERLDRMLKDLQTEYEKAPYEMILFLGDSALDFWLGWLDAPEDGSYLNAGICNSKVFYDQYVPRMPAPVYPMAGNHEQYGHAKWKKISGFPRQYTVVLDDVLFILHDNYADGLDPTEMADSRYTTLDVPYITAKMAAHPGKRVVLCTHFFDPRLEPEAGKRLLRDGRISCLFAGHTHRSRVLALPEDCGSLPYLFTGQYSYSSEDPVQNSMWGFRDLLIEEDRMTSRYIVPANDCIDGGKPVSVSYHMQDEAVILSAKKM